MPARERFDLFIIGSGMAGMAAGLFAANRGLKTALCGSVGGIDFSSGPLDLMAVHPVAEKRVWDNPWEAIEVLTRDLPEHPYAKVGPERIRRAMDEFCAFLAEAGLPYEGYEDRNAKMLTPAGTIKNTYRVPRSMWRGVAAQEERAACLVVGFKGLKGFSSRQIAEVQKDRWPALRGLTIPFPRFHGELYPEHLAMSLADPEMRSQLADAVAAHLRGEEYVAFPAALGLYGAGDVQTEMEERLGAKIFEIPTLPPSMAGLRLRAAFEKHLPARGVRVFSQQMVQKGAFGPDGDFQLEIVGQGVLLAQEPRVDSWTAEAGAVIHAGGRFFGKGLRADRHGLREPVFDLPVSQPANRDDWHREAFFDPRGHPANRAGLETDEALRPLDRAGRPAHKRLFAAGSILAHQDWVRMKCGAGLAIATALKAVEGALGG